MTFGLADSTAINWNWLLFSLLSSIAPRRKAKRKSTNGFLVTSSKFIDLIAERPKIDEECRHTDLEWPSRMNADIPIPPFMEMSSIRDRSVNFWFTTASSPTWHKNRLGKLLICRFLYREWSTNTNRNGPLVLSSRWEGGTWRASFRAALLINLVSSFSFMGFESRARTSVMLSSALFVRAKHKFRLS